MTAQHNIINDDIEFVPLGDRFRGFCPVVIDVETGGFNSQTDALLEVAAIILGVDANGDLHCRESHTIQVQPFEGANLEPASLEVNKIDPFHPLRIAYPEKEALASIFRPIRRTLKENACKRAILVGHNASFDLTFLNVAVQRCDAKNNPFHPFSNFDTVSLGALAYGHTVLARIAELAGLPWDTEEAHSALYDAHMTAEIFCKVMNSWNQKVQRTIPQAHAAPLGT